jgi:hypothetical protein
MSDSPQDMMHTAAPATQDALAVLHEDHQRIHALFEAYQTLVAATATAADRSGLIARIGAALQAHTQIEDELFYPALQGHVPPQALQEAQGSHTQAQALVAQITQDAAPGEQADFSMQALQRIVQAHIAHEEIVFFTAAHSAGLDFATLGALLVTRRATLLGEQGAD